MTENMGFRLLKPNQIGWLWVYLRKTNGFEAVKMIYTQEVIRFYSFQRIFFHKNYLFYNFYFKKNTVTICDQQTPSCTI